jgi:SMI1/KNR4 family protein SUKH-1
MHLEHIPSRFQKLAENHGLNYSIAAAASVDELLRAEQRLGVTFPEQVRLFYRSFNGLRVDDPPLEVLPVGRLNFASPDRLHFATLGGGRPLYFDVSHPNEAGQWDIVSADDYRVTLTMASFWSNKIWAWVEQRRAIWGEWHDGAAT